MKREKVNLDDLLASAVAQPMPEAVQRGAMKTTKSKELEQLAFKVSPDFRMRFKTLALSADLKLNELLYQALDAWEKQRSL